MSALKRKQRRKATPRRNVAPPSPVDDAVDGDGAASGDGSTERQESSSRASYQSSRRPLRQGMSYSLKIMISFIVTALATVLILVLVLRMELQGQFYAYTRANIEELASATASQLAARYGDDHRWTDDELNSAITAYALNRELAVQVIDANGRVVYNGAQVSNPVTGREVTVMEPTDPEAVVEVPVMENGREIGLVRVWAFGNGALITDSGQTFLNNTYLAVTLAAGIAIIIAWFIGAILSRSLSRPISKITATARDIQNGNLAARTGVKGDDELGVLGQTFDEMAASLEADLRMEHRLTSDVAHELRTPLMSIIVNVEAMQDGVLPADTEHLELVAGEVRRLSRLVDAMLRLSRIENGSTPVNAELTDMVGLVQTLVASQEQLFEDQGLTLRFRLDAPKQQVYANVDRDMMRQVVVNLLSNAMRYTPEGGNVVVAVSQNRDDVVISVTDTGIGIEQEDLERVFTRFWRSDASRERDSGGLGVGLSLVREIVNRHGGYMTVESEVGRGSTFSVHIPRYHGWTQPHSS